MPIFDKLKSIFVVPDENPQSMPESTAKTSPSNSGSVNTSDKSPVIITPGQTSEKFIEILSQVLEKNNLPGFDYLEYRKAIQSVAKLQNMDEANQFKTAYAAAQSMNVQPITLIDSAKKYLSILEIEEKNFLTTASTYLQNQVSSKENEANTLVQSISTKKSQIEQLAKELEAAQNRVESIKSEIQAAKEKVETNKANFVASYHTIIDQIKQDIQKMETYLK